MIGFSTSKVQSDIVVANKFARCDSTTQLKNDPEVHVWPQNYEGSSNSMESGSALV